MTTALAARLPIHARDAENQRLARLAQSGDVAARSELIAANVALAWDIALAFANRRRLNDSDCVGFALVVLVQCGKEYDPERGAFSTFAGRSIRLALRRHAIEDRLIHLPNYLFSASAPHHPDRKAEAEAIRAMTLTSLSVRAPGGAADSYYSLVATTADPADEAIEAEESARLDNLIGRLPAMEAEVIRRVFGIGRDGPETMAAVARDMGCSRDAVRDMRDAGVGRLRKMMEVAG